MATIGDIAVKVTADTKQAVDGMRRFASETEQAMDKVHSQTSSVSAMGKKMSGMGRTMTMGLTLPIAAAGVASLKLAGDLEQSEIAFEQMLGSAEKSDAFIRDMQEFAKATPFGFTDVQEQAKRLMAYGFAAEEVIPMLTSIGDAAAGIGKGAETMESITRALGQMRGKGRVQAQEMVQLTEAGISAWEMLADHLGTTVADVTDMVTKGQIDAATGIEAIMAGSAERFGGLMDKQSETMLGKFSNAMDLLKIAAAEFGAAMEPSSPRLSGHLRTC